MFQWGCPNVFQPSPTPSPPPWFRTIATARIAGSPAEDAGLEAGDVIVAVNRRRVRDAADPETAFEQAGSVLALDVVRGNAQLFIVIR